MSQLIQMRRRIKTIDTIHKITNAMRLISMSAHTRLKAKEEFAHAYLTEIEKMYTHIRNLVPAEFDPISRYINPQAPELIIVVGSQKGLSGSFSSNIFNLFSQYVLQAKPHIIAVGKQIIELIKEKKYDNIIFSISTFNVINLKNIVGSISNILTKSERNYSRVIAIANTPKTFFIQKPLIVQLLPLPEKVSLPNIQATPIFFEDYDWEQTAQSILHDLSLLYLQAKIHNVLFQSLLAEQSARFISMDNATRNAEGLLELSRIQYNKLRQAKITKEINELASSM